MVNPAALRHPRWDFMRVAAWGPLANVLLAVGFGLPIRFGWLEGNPAVAQLLQVCVFVNLGLALFNLIPIPPLDGSKILAAFLPDDLAYRYGRFMDQWALILLFSLIFLGNRTGLTDFLIAQPAIDIYRVIVG
jgi:Zn-dependent protease